VEDQIRQWSLDAQWGLVVQEDATGWAFLEHEKPADALAPLRLKDRTGAFGAPFEEFRLPGKSGTWAVRLYPHQKVIAASSPPAGRLVLPKGWWAEESVDSPGMEWGMGPSGTRPSDLECCERRGWEPWATRCSDGLGSGEPNHPASTEIVILSEWHAMDPGHGDTEILHRAASREEGGALRRRLAAECPSALDCRAILRETDTEAQLADAFLFLHQCHGARGLALEGPPSRKVANALERAHMDAQGDLFAAWIVERPVPGRTWWKRLGPCLVHKGTETDPDCYVWLP